MLDENNDGQDSERLERAMETLGQLLDHMGADVDVEGSEAEEQVELAIEGPDAHALIGKKGKTLDALQFLVNKMVSRHGDEHKLVVIDSDGYRERREASLIQLAHRLREKAMDEGKIVKLNPMSPRDRRIIHMTLREMDGISTRSEGEGDERRLLIVPEMS